MPCLQGRGGAKEEGEADAGGVCGVAQPCENEVVNRGE